MANVEPNLSGHFHQLFMKPVSCYVRTLNEERNIGRCIDSVRAIAREVVVVDSGSTDRTVEIARERGAKIILQSWLGNGFQKRIGEEACTSDWLLDLDADEAVTPELADEILALFGQGDPKFPIYSVPMVWVSPNGERFARAGVVRTKKLYDRRVVRQPAHKAWDQFRVPDNIPVGKLSGAIDHWAYPDLAWLAAKQNRASSSRAQNTALPPGWSIRFRILLAFPVYFSVFYFRRKWFRAGWQGFCISGILAFGRWLRDVKRYERELKEALRDGRGDS